MDLQLWDFQEQALDDIRQAYRSGKRAPLLVSPTGSGKTRMFAAITKGAMLRGNRVFILVHRQELVDQVSSALREIVVDHARVSPEFPFVSNKPVQVASVFTLVRRMESMEAPSLIVIDEAHHTTLRSTWGKVIAHYSNARLLGVTATPSRLSGEGLGDIFDCIVMGPSVQALIDTGRLSPVRVFAPPTIDVSGLHSSMGDFKKGELQERVAKPKVTGDAIEHYQTLTPGRRAAVFCVSIEHATTMATAARAAGISAVMIDGTMDKQLRRDTIKDFGNGKFLWLVTVDLISEGFDCPGIEVGISLRPTQSLGLWLQQCGRILRTAPGKSEAIILDHAGNSLRHGLPTEVREWSLGGSRHVGNPDARAASVRVCPKCFAAQRAGKSACGNCGHTFAVDARTLRKARGTLKEITQADIDARRERQQVGRAKKRDELIELGRIRGYKNPEGWAEHVLGGRLIKRKGHGS